VTTWIDAIDRVLSARTLSHVGEEVLEIPPASTDRDAASAVILPSMVGASSNHGSPDSISRRVDLWACVGLIPSNQHLPEDTAAAENGPFAEVITMNGLHGSTIATTHKSRLPLAVAIVKPDDGQSPNARRRRSELAELRHE
jgi:hypothetical protein